MAVARSAAGEPGAGTARRTRIRVTGTVQGVGFRPFVHAVAHELGLAGFVLNDEHGVVVEAEGDAAAVEALVGRLAREAPPLAVVEGVSPEPVPALGATGFRIAASERGGSHDALVSPDAATCDDCLAELLDPSDRRYRYPFVNCTNCGPRFTIARDVPYDRPSTTMAGFEMCERCRAEYDDPLDRRFHAQPNACPDCGPSVRLLDRDGQPPSTAAAAVGAAGGAVAPAPGGAPPDDATAAAAAALRGGAIVAVKGLGGYHLACRADDERAVAALRARKRREDKPFALMAADVDAARALMEVGAEEERLLTGRERPIVLARRRRDAGVAPSVAPRSAELGAMLAYTPLHHLLLADASAPLVMTSGNVADEPIAYEDGEALERLRAIADLFLVHDRPIHVRADDSVVRATARRPLMLRRSRGYVPASTRLPAPTARPLLACGGELKSAFCVARGDRAWVGHHIGDLRTWETLRSYRAGIEHFERLFAVAPEVVAHDLHPDYLSTRYAFERAGVELVGVQHHHAHLAACLAEHGEQGPALGAIYDGSGHGTDGTVWGGELLAGGLGGFERAGHLWAVPLPGGDAAVREPWRMACAWLVAAGAAAAEPPPALAGDIDPEHWRAVARLAAGGPAAPPTSSAGRLFDAVAALCGICPEIAYEGQAAIELEAVADRRERRAYPLPPVGGAAVDAPRRPGRSAPATAGDGPLVLDARATVRAVAADVAAGVPPATVAARFHNGLADGTAAACARLCSARDLDAAVLSGGVFQNRLLLERTTAALEGAGLRVLAPERLPAGDGGLAYGQAAVAATTARSEPIRRRGVTPSEGHCIASDAPAP